MTNNNPAPLEHDRIYHVYNRGVNREPIFRGADNYRYFLDLYLRRLTWLVDTYAYCLLGNHFHFLLRIKAFQELPPDLSDVLGPGIAIHSPSQYFSNFFNAYARAFNIRYHRTGALFERPFGRNPVTDDAYFAYLVVYIHQNPQKHGFVDDFRDWPYSSYHALAGEKPTRLDRAMTIAWLGGRSAFDMVHRQDCTQRHHPSGL